MKIFKSIWKHFSDIANVILLFYTPFTLTKLWQWFIMPWIKEAPPLPFIIAIGILIMIRICTYQVTISDISTAGNDLIKAKELAKIAAITKFGLTTSALITGWIAHFFV